MKLFRRKIPTHLLTWTLVCYIRFGLRMQVSFKSPIKLYMCVSIYPSFTRIMNPLHHKSGFAEKPNVSYIEKSPLVTE